MAGESASVETSSSDIEVGTVSIPSGSGKVTPIHRNTTADDLLNDYAEEETAQAKQSTETKLLPTEQSVNEPTKEGGDPNGQESGEKSKEESAKEVTLKSLKAKLGDKEVDLPEEAVLSEKIGDKEVTFTVKDAIKAWKGQEDFNRNMDRRSTSLSQKEKALQAQYQGLNAKAKQVVDMAVSGDFYSTVRALAQMAAGQSGLDIETFEKQYLDQLENQQKLWSNMTPEQREIFKAQKKAELLAEENQRLKGQSQEVSQAQQLQQQINALCQQANVGVDDFWKTYEALAENEVGEGKRWRTKNEISPEQVIYYSALTKHVQQVESLASEAGINDTAIIDEIIEVTKDKGFSAEQIKRVIEESGLAVNARPAAIENLNRRAQKSGIAPSENKGSSIQKKPELDEEDEEFLYRMAPRQYRTLVR